MEQVYIFLIIEESENNKFHTYILELGDSVNITIMIVDDKNIAIVQISQ